MKPTRIPRHKIRREDHWHEVLPPDRRDPDVVRAKALARAGGPAQAGDSPGSHVLPSLPPASLVSGARAMSAEGLR